MENQGLWDRVDAVELRLEALEKRASRLEHTPVATLVVDETKPNLKKKANRKPLTPEQKQEHVDRLRRGRQAAEARRAEAQVTAAAQPAIAAAKSSKFVGYEEEARSLLVDKEDQVIIEAQLAEIAWDALPIKEKIVVAKYAGIEGKVSSSTWAKLHDRDRAALLKTGIPTAKKKKKKEAK